MVGWVFFGVLDILGLDNIVFCIKCISIYFFVLYVSGFNYSFVCEFVIDFLLFGEGKVLGVFFF